MKSGSIIMFLKAREVDVDFNEAYNDMDPVREILVRAAVSIH